MRSVNRFLPPAALGVGSIRGGFFYCPSYKTIIEHSFRGIRCCCSCWLAAAILCASAYPVAGSCLPVLHLSLFAYLPALSCVVVYIAFGLLFAAALLCKVCDCFGFCRRLKAGAGRLVRLTLSIFYLLTSNFFLLFSLGYLGFLGYFGFLLIHACCFSLGDVRRFSHFRGCAC